MLTEQQQRSNDERDRIYWLTLRFAMEQAIQRSFDEARERQLHNRLDNRNNQGA